MDKPKLVKPKGDPIEEVHFRVDEHERRLHAIEKGASALPDSVAGIVHGALSTFKHEQQGREDKLAARHEQVLAALERLIEVLGKPKTRTATIDLPTGSARMTVHEEHGK